jgi:nitroreductase
MIALNPNVPLSKAAFDGSEALIHQVLDALRARYAVKKFNPDRSIPAAEWEALEEALVLTASGGGLQPWKFVVVDDPAVRARLREVSFDQPQITEADKLVVFAARVGYSEADLDRHVARMAEVRGQTVESLAGLRGMLAGITGRPEADRNAWAARQAYIALGNFLTSAAILGVDACPMEGIQGARYDEILGLGEQGYTALCVATAGYRSDKDPYAGAAKVRFPRAEIVAHV